MVWWLVAAVVVYITGITAVLAVCEWWDLLKGEAPELPWVMAFFWPIVVPCWLVVAPGYYLLKRLKRLKRERRARQLEEDKLVRELEADMERDALLEEIRTMEPGKRWRVAQEAVNKGKLRYADTQEFIRAHFEAEAEQHQGPHVPAAGKRF